MIKLRFCIDCSEPITKEATRCRNCSLKKRWGGNYNESKKLVYHCQICGNPCSDGHNKCQECYLKFESTERIKQFPKRRANGHGFAWKGGRQLTTHRKPYRIIFMPEHPRATKRGYVYEHIVIWEKANNTAIPYGYVIHHLNGDSLDNRSENLVALPQGTHHARLVIQSLARRIKDLEAQLSQQRLNLL